MTIGKNINDKQEINPASNKYQAKKMKSKVSLKDSPVLTHI